GIGISAVSTMLARSAQTHQAQMVGHLSPGNPEYQQRLSELVHAFASQMSPVEALQRAQAMLYGTLVTQSHLWAYVDTFRMLAGLSLVAIPFVFLLKRVRARGGPIAAH